MIMTSKMAMNNLKDIWANQIINSGSGVIKEKILEIPQFNCFIGTVLISKAKFFSIEISNDFNISHNYLKRFTGVEIQVLPSIDSKKDLIILLLENDLSDIFIMFIEDIIKSVSTVSNTENAVLVISQRVAYWKRLFGKFTTGLLTPQQQRGLYGELLTLELLFKELNNNTRVIQAWQAPSGTNQDFYFGKTAIEVKTSKSNHPSIKIANEFQLDSNYFDNLFIAFIKLIELPGAEATLLKKIIDIREILAVNQELLDDFNLKLSYLGISPDLENEYNKTSYNIRSITYFQVKEGFPRIISSMIDNRITHISYEISPTDCSEFEIPFKTVIKEVLNAE